MATVQEKSTSKGLKGIKLSETAIRERIRIHAPKLIEEALRLALLPQGVNDNCKLGAIKLLLAKVIPDVTKSELVGSDGASLEVKWVQSK